MDNTEKYYKSFGLDRSLPRSFLKKQELNQLFAIPKKEPTKLSAHIYNFEEDNTHQADILFFPHDTVGKKKYAYALIVVDVAMLTPMVSRCFSKKVGMGPQAKMLVKQ